MTYCSLACDPCFYCSTKKPVTCCYLVLYRMFLYLKIRNGFDEAHIFLSSLDLCTCFVPVRYVEFHYFRLIIVSLALFKILFLLLLILSCREWLVVINCSLNAFNAGNSQFYSVLLDLPHGCLIISPLSIS